MVKCFISEHCLLEKNILVNNIRFTVHYLVFHPVIEASLEYSSGFGIVLFSGKFEYRRDYDSFLNFFFSDEDDGL